MNHRNEALSAGLAAFARHLLAVAAKSEAALKAVASAEDTVTDAAFARSALFMHIHDRRDREGTWGLGLTVVKNEHGQYGIALLVDGWYSTEELAQDAMGFWQWSLDANLEAYTE